MKIGLISLGCPKNLVDGEVMLGLAQEAGHELTPHAADADVLVVNTCAFIDRAKQESVDAILEMAELKKAAPVTAARRHGLPGRTVSRRAAGPDPRDRRGARHRRGAATSSARSAAPLRPSPRPVSSPLVVPPPAALDNGAPAARRPDRAADLHLRRRHAARARDAAPLRLREGCRRAATTSAPSASSRGCAGTTAAVRRSRSSTEARRLAARGVRELILISQDTTFYGIDRQRARRARPAAARAERGRRPRVDPAALPLPDDHRRRDARRDGRVRQGRQVHRPAAAARVGSPC